MLKAQASRKTFANDSYKLFVQFLENFLGVTFKGFQSGFGFRPDLILFDAPGNGDTLAIPISTMLLPQAEARALVEQKISANKKLFEEGETV